MQYITTNSTPSEGGSLGASNVPSKQSRLVELIERHELTDAIEATGLHGENALFAIAALQCWLCSSQEFVIVPAIADTLKPCKRCAHCDCFLGVLEGGAE